jgi:hypothetical protein
LSWWERTESSREKQRKGKKEERQHELAEKGILKGRKESRYAAEALA